MMTYILVNKYKSYQTKMFFQRFFKNGKKWQNGKTFAIKITNLKCFDS